MRQDVAFCGMPICAAALLYAKTFFIDLEKVRGPLKQSYVIKPKVEWKLWAMSILKV